MSTFTNSAKLTTAPIEVRPLPTTLDEWVERFDSIYADAGVDCTRIPWSHPRANPALMAWLNVQASSMVRPGSRVAVVGCGLGQDAIALIERGYDVCAFDACAHAIENAKRLHAEHSASFHQMDLRELPAKMTNRFDLVVEVHTLQSLPVENRPMLAEAIASLLNHRGVLLAVARGRDGPIPASTPTATLDGPPFPLTAAELEALFTGELGLTLDRPIDDYEDGNSPPVRRLRAIFRKG